MSHEFAAAVLLVGVVSAATLLGALRRRRARRSRAIDWMAYPAPLSTVEVAYRIGVAGATRQPTATVPLGSAGAAAGEASAQPSMPAHVERPQVAQRLPRAAAVPVARERLLRDTFATATGIAAIVLLGVAFWPSAPTSDVLGTIGTPGRSAGAAAVDDPSPIVPGPGSANPTVTAPPSPADSGTAAPSPGPSVSGRPRPDATATGGSTVISVPPQGTPRATPRPTSSNPASTPRPTATPGAPSPAPGSSSTPAPTAPPTPTPSTPPPTVAPTPTPTPTPEPTPTPTPEPTTEPTPVPTPEPTPVPTPEPTPEATPTPTPEPVVGHATGTLRALRPLAGER